MKVNYVSVLFAFCFKWQGDTKLLFEQGDRPFINRTVVFGERWFCLAALDVTLRIVSLTTSPPEPGDADVFDFTGRMQRRSIARGVVSLCGASLSDLPRTGSSRLIKPARTWSDGLRVRDWVGECRSRLHSRFWMSLLLCPLFKVPLNFFFDCFA